MSEGVELNYNQKPAGFTWDSLGNLHEGRSTLGFEMPVLVYRLFQYTLKDILSREYGSETAAALYRAAGHLAGMEFAKQLLELSGDFDFFFTTLQRKLVELKIGILRLEYADYDKYHFTITIAEDLDCSGLPVTGEIVCEYDEGFIAGILEAYSGRKFKVVEVDCWATGDRVCRFTATAE